jgi:hypothetical protein
LISSKGIKQSKKEQDKSENIGICDHSKAERQEERRWRCDSEVSVLGRVVNNDSITALVLVMWNNSGSATQHWQTTL